MREDVFPRFMLSAEWQRSLPPPRPPTHPPRRARPTGARFPAAISRSTHVRGRAPTAADAVARCDPPCRYTAAGGGGGVLRSPGGGWVGDAGGRRLVLKQGLLRKKVTFEGFPEEKILES